MKWTLFRRKPEFMPGYLYVCQCNWGWYYSGHGRWYGPYWEYDSIAEKYEHKFTYFDGIVSGNHHHAEWKWDVTPARKRTLQDIDDNYSDCYGWLMRQANGGHKAP